MDATPVAGQSPTIAALIVAIGCVATLSILLALLAIGLRLKNMRTAALWRRLEERWQPLVLAGLAEDAFVLPESAVRPGEQFRFLLYLARFARRLEGPERESIVRMASPYLPILAARARAGSAEDRAFALRTLGGLGLEQHREVLLEALDAPEPLVAMTAARQLAAHGDPGDARRILSRLDLFRAWDPGFLASMAASFGPPGAETLVHALADSAWDEEHRALAARALAALNALEGGPIAIAILRDGVPGPALARAALDLLARVGDASSLPQARRHAASDDAETVCAALRAIGSLGSAEDRGRLREALDHPSPWVRLEAGRALLAIGGRSVLESAAEGSGARAALAREILAEAA